MTAELQGIARTPGSGYEDARATCEALSANEREATRWTITAAGASIVAGWRTRACLDDPTDAHAEAMLAGYELAERLADEEAGR